MKLTTETDTEAALVHVARLLDLAARKISAAAATQVEPSPLMFLSARLAVAANEAALMTPAGVDVISLEVPGAPEELVRDAVSALNVIAPQDMTPPVSQLLLTLGDLGRDLRA